MAILPTSMIRFGRVGPVVYYKRGNKICLRAHHKHIKQTAATKAAAGLFGRAVRCAKYLRYGIYAIMHDPTDRAIMYKMNKAVQFWLRTQTDLPVTQDRLPYLHGLDINKFNRIKFPIEVDWTEKGMVHIMFPAFNPKHDLAIKSGTTHLVWKIAVTGVTVAAYPLPVKEMTASFTTPYGDINLPENIVSIPYTLEAGTINIVALALHLRYDEFGNRQKQKTWEPAGIVAARFNA